MLSRLPLKTQSNVSEISELHNMQINVLPVDSDMVRLETCKDAILAKVIGFLEKGSWPKQPISAEYTPYHEKTNDLTLHDGIIYGGYVSLSLDRYVVVFSKNYTPSMLELHE